jgi:RNA polymerase sigma-70 factor (ECF subfamily)
MSAIGFCTELHALPATGTLVVVHHAGMTDEELLERIARDRDPAAFDEVYARYSRAVYSLVRRVIRDAGASEDVVQDAFAAVWRAASSYRRDRGSATGWMFAIARNAATDAARGRRLTVVSDPPDQADPGPGPEERVASELEAFRIHSAVDRLPPNEREIIELAYFGGLSQSEIADRLGLPLGTVKTRNRRGLERLSEALEGEVTRL